MILRLGQNCKILKKKKKVLFFKLYFPYLIYKKTD